MVYLFAAYENHEKDRCYDEYEDGEEAYDTFVRNLGDGVETLIFSDTTDDYIIHTLDAVRGCETLTSVRMSYIISRSIERIVSLLETMPSLKKLKIQHSFIEDFGKISEFLGSSTTIEMVELSSIPIREHCMWDFLGTNTSIRTLVCSEVGEYEAMIKELRPNTTLTSLSIPGHTLECIPDALLEFLRDNHTLTALNISAGNIRDITGFVDALSSNTTLTTLNLSRNKISDTSEISRIITTNTTLTSLFAFENSLSDTPILEALCSNTSLTCIDMGIDGPFIGGIGNVLDINPTITHLCYPGSHFGQVFPAGVREKLVRNRQNATVRRMTLFEMMWGECLPYIDLI